MSAIGPGDWVECVDVTSDVAGTGHDWQGERVPVEGQIYQVSDAWVDCDGYSVILVGWERDRAARDWGRRCGFAIERFRPIYRPKADLIESLKTPAKREHQPA